MGVTNVNPDNPENVDQETTGSSSSAAAAGGGLPLRGFAMVLIAVAVGLGLWALYALTQGDGSDQASQTAASSETSVAADDNNGGQDTAAPADPTTPTAPAEEEDPAAQEGARDDNPDDPAAGSDDAASNDAPAAPSAGQDGNGGEATASDNRAAASTGGGAAAPAPAEPMINVFNNSTVPNLAAEVSEQLEQRDYRLGEVGNFADEILPETTVFFDPSNARGEQEARELADTVNGVARENIDALPDEAKNPNDITLVMVGEVAF